VIGPSFSESFEGPQRLLVLRALGLGDFLTGVPAYKALHRAFPDARIILGAPPVLAPLAALTGAVDGVLPFSAMDGFSGAAVPWSGPAPGLAVNLHGRGPQSTRALLATGASRVLAFAGEGVSGPEWDPGEHEVRRWCRMLSSYGIEADASDLLLAPAPVPSPGPDAVLIHPGAASGSRRWPPERYAEVARVLCGDGIDVGITGGPSEVALAEHVAELAGLPRSSVLAGQTSLLELTALVQSARLVVCGDTGMAHLASAAAVPSVVLFGPVSPALWGPPAHGPHTVLWHGDGYGDPHGEAVDPSLARLKVTEVLDAAGVLLGTPSGAAR
jgi:ADP-heptose:LPS heptosyltransferase